MSLNDSTSEVPTGFRLKYIYFPGVFRPKFINIRGLETLV